MFIAVIEKKEIDKMKMDKVKVDLDNAVIGKITLNNQMIAVYLIKLFDEIKELKDELEELKREIRFIQ